MSLIARVGAAIRGAVLPDPRSSRGFLLFGGSPFNIRRRQTRQLQVESFHGWVGAATNRIATDVRQTRFFLGTEDPSRPGEVERFPDTDIPDVIAQPGRHMDQEAFVELSIRHLDLAGEFFWYIITDRDEPGGTPIGLQILYPHWIDCPLHNEQTGFFDRWRVEVPGRPPVEIPMEDVIWTFRPHPVETFRAASPIEQIAITYDFDLYAKAYGAQIMESGGMPPGLLSLESQVERKEAAILKSRWREQRQTPEDIMVLGKGAKFERFGQTIKDMEWSLLAKQNRDQILAIYGVPAFKLGIVEDVNRNTSEESDTAYEKDVLRPRLRMLRKAYNRVLDRLGESRRMFFEDPVGEDAEFKLKRANDALDRGVIQVDEYRMETGRQEVEAGGGKVYMLPSGKRISETIEPGPDPMEGLPPPDDDGGDDDEDNEGRNDDRRSAAVAILNVGTLDNPARVIDAVSIDGAAASTEIPAESASRGPGQVLSLPAPEDFRGLTGRDVVRTLQARGLIPIDLPISDTEYRQQAAIFEVRQEREQRVWAERLASLFRAERKALVKAIRQRKRRPRITNRSQAFQPPMDWWERETRVGEDGKVFTFLDIDWPLDEEDDAGIETQRRDVLDQVFNQQRLSWRRMVRTRITRGWESGWDLLSEETGRDLLAFSEDQEISQMAREQSETTVEELRSTTRRFLAGGLAAFLAAREADNIETSVDDVAEEVSRLYEDMIPRRVRVISRTESAAAINAGKQLHMDRATEALPVSFRNVWNAILDGNVRDAHAAAHGQRRAIGTAFDVGGEKLRYPLDPRGSAGNVINCRCTLLTEIVEES